MNNKLVEQFLNLRKVEDKEKYLDIVWDMIEKSYAKVGGQHSVKNKESLLEDRYFWKLVRRGSTISAFAIYKTTHGRKLSLCGTNGTQEGKKDLYMIIDEDLRIGERGVWAEVSDSIEHLYLDKVYNRHKTGRELGLLVPAEKAVRILNKLGKPAVVVTKENAMDPKNADGFHYQRVIGKGSGQQQTFEKCLIGYLPDELLDKGNDVNETLELDEDKTVNIGGTPYPKFGWCVIMLGGPGSGKTTHYKKLVNIDAKYYNTDDFKSYLLDNSEFTGNVMTLKNGKEIDLDVLGIEPPYNLSNPRFVSLLHSEARGISNKYKANMYSSGKNVDLSRLPNIAFDLCGSDIKDIIEIVDNVKSLGYKIAIVWVITGIDEAIKRADSRERKSSHSLILKKHNDVYYTIGVLLNDKKLINSIDEFWVILDDYTFDLNNPDEKINYMNNPNCFKLEKSDVVNLPDKIEDVINTQRQRVLDLINSEEM